MTLFDEAEAATGLGCIGTVGALTRWWDPLSSQSYYVQPLPIQDVAWIDNYISLAGLLQRKARNVILTFHSPRDGLSGSGLRSAVEEFHAYPYNWYSQTVMNPLGAVMGYHWSFEEGGFVGAPTANMDTVYLQSGSELNLVPTNYDGATSLLSQRSQKYFDALVSVLIPTEPQGARSSGQVTGRLLVTTPMFASDLLVNLQNGPGNGSFLSGSKNARSASGGNTPAYAWIPLFVPSNAFSMSFDFMLEGDGDDDSFAAAVNGTNVLSLKIIFAQTNVTLNSGLIDVSAWAGQQIELFLGIVGGTSTNASLTVSGFRFYSVEPPTLHAQAVGSDFIVTWPLSADEYVLERTTTLTGTNSWTTVTNLPVIVDLQNTVTNAMPGSSKFYRLRKP